MHHDRAAHAFAEHVHGKAGMLPTYRRDGVGEVGGEQFFARPYAARGRAAEAALVVGIGGDAAALPVGGGKGEGVRVVVEAVEGDEPSSEAAVEAEALADDVAEAPTDDIEEAEEFATAGEEADAESDDHSEADEPETEAAEAAVGDDKTEPSEDQAAEEEAAVVDAAESAAEDEPKTGVLEEAKVEAVFAGPAYKPTPVQRSGGRLSRWLRRNR